MTSTPTAKPPVTQLNSEQINRYKRHLILPEVGMEGQKKLLNAKVLCIGAGGLGCPISLYLAAAGVGTIGLADVLGMPVSTTHVLSSGVAGTMWANRSGIQSRTMINIALAWVLTLPASMALSMLFFWLSHKVLV